MTRPVAALPVLALLLAVAVAAPVLRDPKLGISSRTSWYAPGIGEVKNVNTAGVGKGYVRVLKSYDPGRE